MEAMSEGVLKSLGVSCCLEWSILEAKEAARGIMVFGMFESFSASEMEVGHSLCPASLRILSFDRQMGKHVLRHLKGGVAKYT